MEHSAISNIQIRAVFNALSNYLKPDIIEKIVSYIQIMPKCYFPRSVLVYYKFMCKYNINYLNENDRCQLINQPVTASNHAYTAYKTLTVGQHRILKRDFHASYQINRSIFDRFPFMCFNTANPSLFNMEFILSTEPFEKESANSITSLLNDMISYNITNIKYKICAYYFKDLIILPTELINIVYTFL